jgi:hypothetical protein
LLVEALEALLQAALEEAEEEVVAVEEEAAHQLWEVAEAQQRLEEGEEVVALVSLFLRQGAYM